MCRSPKRCQNEHARLSAKRRSCDSAAITEFCRKFLIASNATPEDPVIQYQLYASVLTLRSCERNTAEVFFRARLEPHSFEN